MPETKTQVGCSAHGPFEVCGHTTATCPNNKNGLRDVNVDGKFWGREVRQFQISQITGASGNQLGGDSFTEAYLETASGNIYKIYEDEDGGYKIADARSNKGAGRAIKGTALTAEDLNSTVKVGEQFRYGEAKRLNTSPITRITLVNKARLYVEDALPREKSDVSNRLKQTLLPEKKPTEIVEKRSGGRPTERALLDRTIQYPMQQSIEQAQNREVILKKRATDGGNIKFKNGVLEMQVDGTETIGVVYDGKGEDGSPIPDSYMPSTNIIALSKTTMDNFGKRDKLPNARSLVEQLVRHELNHYLFERLPKTSRDKILSIFLKYAKKKDSSINKFFDILYGNPESPQSQYYVLVAKQNLKALKSHNESPQAVTLTDSKGVKHSLAFDSIVDEMLAFASYVDVNFNPDQLGVASKRKLDSTDLQFQQILKMAASAMSELTQEELSFIQRELFRHIPGSPEQASKKYMDVLMKGVEIIEQENS